jgi:hypothetical protein
LCVFFLLCMLSIYRRTLCCSLKRIQHMKQCGRDKNNERSVSCALKLQDFSPFICNDSYLHILLLANSFFLLFVFDWSTIMYEL